MRTTPELYELSFVAPNKKRRTPPYLVFTVKERHLAEISERLDTLAGRYAHHAERYCRTHAYFHPLAADLFGTILFGYGRCGFMSTQKEDARLHVELRGKDAIFASTLTIHLLTMALALPFEGQADSNREQQVDIMTCCSRDRHFHGHSVGGYVSGNVRRWLIREGSRIKNASYAPIHADISAAMRSTWRAVTDGRVPRKEEFHGMISRDGRFMLQCPGNACDLSIYPDNVSPYESTDLPVRFSCHNLDGAHQQLTLLAGLAKLCELARRDDS